MRFVLEHPSDGVYLGTCYGRAFWSKHDPVGQPEATTFESEELMWEHINSWDTCKELAWKKGGFRAVPVDTDSDYATIADCVSAGLDAWEA